MDLLQEDFVALLEICAAKGNEAHLLHVLEMMQETIYALPPESMAAMTRWTLFVCPVYVPYMSRICPI